MKITTLYCELLTHEEVTEFETLMDTVACCDRFNRPGVYAEREPYWMKTKQPRGENDDPLAAVILTLYHTSAQYSLSAGYRCVEGEKIEPEMMKNFILALNYSRLPRM